MSFFRFIWIVLIGFIGYQVGFRWVPLWRNPSELQGTDVAEIQIQDENGQWVQLSEFKGNILVINFWASRCIPCRLEIPLLNSIHSIRNSTSRFGSLRYCSLSFQIIPTLLTIRY